MENKNKPGCKARLIGTGHAEGLGGNANATPGGDMKRSFRHLQRVNRRRSLTDWMGGWMDVFSYFWRARAGWT